MIKDRKIISAIVFVQLFLIMALRSDSLGVDVDIYHSMYYHYGSLSFNSVIQIFDFFKVNSKFGNIEWGYIFTNWLFYKAGLSFHSFLVFISIVFLLAVCLLFYRYSDDIGWSYILFMAFGTFTFSFCILRQCLSTAIIIFAFILIDNKHYIGFVLLVILAGLFHRSGYLALLLLPLVFVEIKPNIIRYYGIGNVILLFLSSSIYILLHSSIGNLIGKNSYVASAFSLNIYVIILFILLVIIYLFEKRANFISEDKSNLLKFAMFSLPLEVLACINGILGRIAILSFFPFLVCWIPTLLNPKRIKFKQTQVQTVIYGIGYLSLLLFYLYSLSNTSMKIVPYEFFF